VARRIRQGLAAAIAATLTAPVFAGGDLQQAVSQTYRIDPQKSSVAIHVGKSGIFSFAAGHTKEVNGPIQEGTVALDLDAPARSHMRLVIAASALKVSPAGEPEGDPPKVQEAMETKVLDVAHHPHITYESSGVTVKSRQAGVLDLVLVGLLTIRGASQSVTVPVRVSLADHTLTATGRMEIKQTAFGIKPISIAGVVAVKDSLAIDFSIAAAATDQRP